MQLVFSDKVIPNVKPNGNNRLAFEDRCAHDWYRFVLSFPPHLVREYLQKFELTGKDLLLDPFCGTGTTVVEAKNHNIPSIGIEANDMAFFASSTKTNWNIDPYALFENSKKIAFLSEKAISSHKPSTLLKLSDETNKLLLKDSISEIPLHKALILLDCIKENAGSSLVDHELLAFAKSLVFGFSNLYFGPEVGVRKTKLEDAPVVDIWIKEIEQVTADLKKIRNNKTASQIFHADSRNMVELLEPKSISAVFTSPPYPNEKDYTRTTRLESVLLGFLNNKEDLRKIKKSLIRSNTRGVYKGDDDDLWIGNNNEILALANEIEEKRISLGKTSGFERMYGRVTKLYFGGMARHLADLRQFLKPGAYLGYVVGDQASYLQVLIKTGHILANIAEELGYEVISIDLFRTRLSTSTKQQMREEVVVLRWPK